MNHYLGLITAVLLILCGIFACLSDVFLSLSNLSNILLASSTIGILAIGAAFVIGGAGLDLSVGSQMALSAMAAVIAANTLALPWYFIPLLCLIIGVLTGGINGYLIGYRKVLALIVTLGMLSMARGASFIFSDGRPVYGLPEPLLFFGQGQIVGIPVPVMLFLLTGIAVHILLRHTVFGRHTLAIGDNENAARNAGIEIAGHKLCLYVFSGILAALAGLVFMARVNAADPNAGAMYELTAITAAIIGGTSLFGGRTSIAGAMLGALIMGVLQNGLSLMNVPAYYQQVVIGAVLILAVMAGNWKAKTHAPA